MTDKDECNSGDCACSRESSPIVITDAMGREVFWEDAGRPEDK
jgi:hypothetical protein